jgi:hypothetical protein
MRSSARSSIKPVHPYAWLWEPLEEEPSLVLRAMFGTKAAYIGGRLMLCFSAQAEPWHGVLICTERQWHASLMAEFPGVSPHPVLPKWLYLPDADPAFEARAQRLVKMAARRDPRLGVEGSVRKGRAGAKPPGRPLAD